MRKFMVVILFALVTCVGCSKDARIKRQVSLLNVKTQVAAAEYKEAKTPEAKDKVATEYFNTAPKMTQVVEDYMFGREPQEPKPTPPTTARMVDYEF